MVIRLSSGNRISSSPSMPAFSASASMMELKMFWDFNAASRMSSMVAGRSRRLNSESPQDVINRAIKIADGAAGGGIRDEIGFVVYVVLVAVLGVNQAGSVAFHGLNAADLSLDSFRDEVEIMVAVDEENVDPGRYNGFEFGEDMFVGCENLTVSWGASLAGQTQVLKMSPSRTRSLILVLCFRMDWSRNASRRASWRVGRYMKGIFGSDRLWLNSGGCH